MTLEHRLYGDDLRQLIEAALDALPERLRVVFVLPEVEGLSTIDTAKCLGINAATVKTRLHRAKAALRLHIGSRLGFPDPSFYAFHLVRYRALVAEVMRRLGHQARPPDSL